MTDSSEKDNVYIYVKYIGMVEKKYDGRRVW